MITRAKIEEALPKAYDVERYEILNLCGRVRREKADVTLRIPGNRMAFRLEETSTTASWFRKLNDYLKKTDTWAVSGTMSEKKAGRGIFARTQMTISAVRIANCKLRGSEGVEPVTLRLFIDDVKDAEKDGPGLERQVKRLRGAEETRWDPEAGILTVTWNPGGRIEPRDLRKAVGSRGTVSKITVDGLQGRTRSGRGDLILKSRAGQDFHLRAEKGLMKLADRIARAMIQKGNDEFRISGELVENEGSFEVILKSLRPLNANR